MADRTDVQEHHGNIFVELFWTLVLFFKAIFVAMFRSIFGGPEKSVEGEKILITGAGSGLGRLMAVDFAQRGAVIVAWDINQAANEETAKLVKEKGGKIHTFTVDIRYT